MTLSPAPAGASGLRTDSQSLAALGAATLEDETAILGAHPDQKPVPAAATATVGLKRAFTLHDNSGLPRITPRSRLCGARVCSATLVLKH